VSELLTDVIAVKYTLTANPHVPFTYNNSPEAWRLLNYTV